MGAFSLLSFYSQNMGNLEAMSNLEASGSHAALSAVRPSLCISEWVLFWGVLTGTIPFLWEMKTMHYKLPSIQKHVKHSIFLYFQKFILEFKRLLRAP